MGLVGRAIEDPKGSFGKEEKPLEEQAINEFFDKFFPEVPWNDTDGYVRRVREGHENFRDVTLKRLIIEKNLRSDEAISIYEKLSLKRLLERAKSNEGKARDRRELSIPNSEECDKFTDEVNYWMRTRKIMEMTLQNE